MTLGVGKRDEKGVSKCMRQWEWKIEECDELSTARMHASVFIHSTAMIDLFSNIVVRMQCTFFCKSIAIFELHLNDFKQFFIADSLFFLKKKPDVDIKISKFNSEIEIYLKFSFKFCNFCCHFCRIFDEIFLTWIISRWVIFLSKTIHKS